MKLLLNRWVIACVAVAFLLLKFFWIDLVEQSGESFQATSSIKMGVLGLSDEEVASVTGFKLAPARNNPDQVVAEHVRVVARDGATRTLAFDLVSHSPDNAYPSLRVTLSRRNGQPSRVVDFTPAQYGHGKALINEEVRLPLDVVDGEARATVVPFYSA